MLDSQSINVMDKVTIQCGSLRKSYDIFSLPSQMYDFMEREGFCLPRRKTIADVPNEILTSIFQRLDRKSLISVLSVCQRFFDHGAPLLWYTVCCCGCVGTSQDEEDRFDLPELLAEVLSKPATSRSYELFIRELNIMVAGSLSAQLLCSIQPIFDSIPNMSNLTHLKLSFAREEHSQAFSERMASNISCTFIELMKLPRLQVLNVEPHNMDIVCQVLETEYNFSLENSTIDKMCFGLCTMPVSEGHFQQFIQSFKALESLELWDVGALSISLWAEILSSETITRLDLNYAEFEIVDNHSVTFSSKLESLLLYQIFSESDALRVFLSPMSLLTRLEFRNCHFSNTGDISPIAQVIPQLEIFSYSRMADTFGPLFFRGIACRTRSSRLRKLSIELSLVGESVLLEFMGISTLEEVCVFDTEVSASKLAEFFHSNTVLRHVLLHHYPFEPSYLLPLLQHCPKLETFTTFESVEMSIQKLDKLVRNYPIPRLPIFQFKGVYGIEKINCENYLRMFPRLANHVKFI